jgi:hypothetical protein
MKKSRSSTPRLDARLPGLEGIGGPERVGCEAAPPLVAIAVGNTLHSGRHIAVSIMGVHEDHNTRTMMGPNCLQTCHRERHVRTVYALQMPLRVPNLGESCTIVADNGC